jgi:hypothetical protein
MFKKTHSTRSDAHLLKWPSRGLLWVGERLPAPLAANAGPTTSSNAHGGFVRRSLKRTTLKLTVSLADENYNDVICVPELLTNINGYITCVPHPTDLEFLVPSLDLSAQLWMTKTWIKLVIGRIGVLDLQSKLVHHQRSLLVIQLLIFRCLSKWQP